MKKEIKTGEDLREWRKKNKLSQRKLAEKIGYTPQHVCQLEKGDKMLSDKLIFEVKKLNRELNPAEDYEAIFDALNSNIYEIGEAYKDFEKKIIDILLRKHQFCSPEQSAKYYKYMSECLEALLYIIRPTVKEDAINRKLKEVKNKAIEFRSMKSKKKTGEDLRKM